MALSCLVLLTDRCYFFASDPHPPLKVMAGFEIGGVYMKLMHLCFAALGFAVARWVFRRQPVADPVSRLRSSGLL